MLPALLITVCLMILVAILARRHNLPRDEVRASWAEARRTTIACLPALFAPVILVGGLVSGWFGPTEVAAMTVVYALLLGFFVYKKLTWASLIEAAHETVRATAAILFIVATAALFAWILTIEQVPVKISALLLNLSESPVMLLLLVNAMLLVIGMIMESIAAILILAPILVPALAPAGVDPLHLGIVVVLNLMIGLLTPPVGLSLYMISSISGLPVERVLKGTLPFFVPLLVALLVVTLIPSLSTWLPGLIFG